MNYDEQAVGGLLALSPRFYLGHTLFVFNPVARLVASCKTWYFNSSLSMNATAWQ